MGIRQKFFALAGLVGVILTVVSCVGYYTAYQSLDESIEQEILATVEVQGRSLDGWLSNKGQIAVSAANLMEAQDGNPAALTKEMLSLSSNDKEVLALGVGTEDRHFVNWPEGDLTGRLDPTTRPWYKEAKNKGKLFFTDAYQDAVTKKMIISAVVPYKGRDGAFRGAVCEDISLAVLGQRVTDIKYRERGKGMIIDPKGLILASTQDGEAMTQAAENGLLKENFAAMVQKGKGYFLAKKDGDSRVVAYTTVPDTGWLMAVSVPESFVFAQMRTLKITYAILTLAGLILIVFASLQFSNKITRAIVRLTQRAGELAKGDFRQEDLPVESSDELGKLAQGFNTMSHSIRELISKMAATAEQVAASSEELTAGAQQSAQAATNVASTVVDVANGMEDQLRSVTGAKKNVDSVFNDITQMTGKTGQVADNSVQTAAAASKGEELMGGAMQKMESIERSVMNSADVVRKLGDNSQQIGQIVETISSIAEQTNLLALNAAIEAARAGTAGRGFSVVAEEVRKLAEQSRAATEEIKERIAVIQSDTDQAVVAMQNGTAEVQEGTTAIRAVGGQFTDIMRMVDEIKNQMEEINSSVKTVSAGTTNIVTAVDSIDAVSRTTFGHTQTISAAAEEQSASSEEIASASQALAGLATELQHAAAKFKV
jgi:methyl-accepting chemotaxis protein